MIDIEETLKSVRVIPVIVIEDASKAVEVAKALVKGGLNVLEVTFRTAAAEAAIRAIREEVPEAVVGAGTLISKAQLHAAKAAGAVFGVAPGFDADVVAEAQQIGLPFVPGIVTASELTCALNAGLKVVKFFPAEAAGGIAYIKNLLGAFRFTGVKFMPTGGINRSNMSDYLSVKEVLAIGGSWLVPKDALAEGRWDEITRLAADAVSALNEK